MINRAEMDFTSFTMLGGDEGIQPSLVKYSDPNHTPASIRYSVKSESIVISIQFPVEAEQFRLVYRPLHLSNFSPFVL